MSLVHLVLTIYIWILLITALLSWFPAPSGGGLASGKMVLARLTEPVLRPVRQLMPRARIGGVGLDLSILIVVIVLELINTRI